MRVGDPNATDHAGEARRQRLAETGDPAPVLPFGVTLLGEAWTDEYLWGIASAFCDKSGLGCGPKGHGLAS